MSGSKSLHRIIGNNEKRKEVKEYISIIAKKTHVSKSTENHAYEILSNHPKYNYNNPLGAAAGVLYLASFQDGGKITQKMLAQASNISISTVRSHYRKIYQLTNPKFTKLISYFKEPSSFR